MLHKWWLYMIFTVFCCTIMNHCNPDSSTKTHISSHTKHVLFNNSSLQKIHIPSHPEHAFFHKGSHPLMLRKCCATFGICCATFPWTKKTKKIPAIVGARIGLLVFFGVFFCCFWFFLVFWFFGCLVVWLFGFFCSTKWPCRKCMSAIKIHCKYQWF